MPSFDLPLKGSCFGFLGYAFLKYAQNAADSGQMPERAKAMRGLGWTVAAATLIFLCVIFFLWDTIQKAIKLVKAASAAVNDMWQMVCTRSTPRFDHLHLCFLHGLDLTSSSLHLAVRERGGGLQGGGRISGRPRRGR